MSPNWGGGGGSAKGKQLCTMHIEPINFGDPYLTYGCEDNPVSNSTSCLSFAPAGSGEYIVVHICSTNMRICGVRSIPLSMLNAANMCSKYIVHSFLCKLSMGWGVNKGSLQNFSAFSNFCLSLKPKIYPALKDFSL